MLPASYLRALGRRWLARPSRTLFRALLGLAGLLLGVCLWYRTTNLWTLKNLGDGFLTRQALRREILLGAFHRAPQEQNGPGSFAVSCRRARRCNAILFPPRYGSKEISQDTVVRKYNTYYVYTFSGTPRTPTESA